MDNRALAALANISMQERRSAQGLDRDVPIILRNGVVYDADVDRFFLDLPLNGVRSPHSLRAYGYDVMVWIRFLATACGKAVWAAEFPPPIPSASPDVSSCARKKSQPRNGAGEIFITAAAEIARETVSDIKAGKVQIIVVYKVDRLTRSLADFAKIVDVLDAHDASFVSVTQQFNTTTSMGRLTLNMLLRSCQRAHHGRARRRRCARSAGRAPTGRHAQQA